MSEMDNSGVVPRSCPKLRTSIKKVLFFPQNLYMGSAPVVAKRSGKLLSVVGNASVDRSDPIPRAATWIDFNAGGRLPGRTARVARSVRSERTSRGLSRRGGTAVGLARVEAMLPRRTARVARSVRSERTSRGLSRRGATAVDRSELFPRAATWIDFKAGRASPNRGETSIAPSELADLTDRKNPKDTYESRSLAYRVHYRCDPSLSR